MLVLGTPITSTLYLLFLDGVLNWFSRKTFTKFHHHSNDTKCKSFRCWMQLVMKETFWTSCILQFCTFLQSMGNCPLFHGDKGVGWGWNWALVYKIIFVLKQSLAKQIKTYAYQSYKLWLILDKRKLIYKKFRNCFVKWGTMIDGTLCVSIL